MRLLALVFVALLAVGCGASSTAQPSAPGSTALLSGQSNAGGVAPFLVAAYRPSDVFVSAHGGEPIRKWAPGSLYWNELARLLRQPLKAFIWWQGENDLESTTYLADVTDLVARVRAANRTPDLLVIVIRILPQPHGWGAGVRAAQEAFVQADVNAVLVSSDGVPAQADGVHLTDAGYRQVAARIVEVLRKQ
ncbi:MAG TPA: sialate O-acetylesterase [Candidatus Dormibacteraeota bacterium]|nr:sialate O-acetylesterase [Candidatus Dormibacteraeota bacterium]